MGELDVGGSAYNSDLHEGDNGQRSEFGPIVSYDPTGPAVLAVVNHMRPL